MTAHVAEANEARGRVILRVSAWSPNDIAIQAAMLVANAFNSEVEILLVEDSQRIDFARFPFAKEFSLRGGAPRAVSADAVRGEIHAAFASARQRVATVAADLEVPTYEHVVRDDPLQALVSACARRGPWNMIAIAETIDSQKPSLLDDVFDAVRDATGVIVAGPAADTQAEVHRRSGRKAGAKRAGARSRAASGPVVLAVEDLAHIQGMLRAGRYIAAALETEIVVLLIAETDDELTFLEGEVRLLLAGDPDVRLARSGATFGNQAAVAEVIRRQESCFLIAQYGGAIAPRRRSLRPLTNALPCPVLLVR